MLKTRILTPEAFEALADLPENRDRRLEYHDGEIVEVVSNSKSSRIAARILSRLEAFVSERRLGFTTGADGGYIIAGQRYIPDAAFMSRDRQAEPPDAAYNPVAPDLAVEVLSPTDDRDALRIKVVNYLSAGTVVWLFDPEKHRVEIYRPGQPEQTLDIDDVLEGGPMLPGFSLPIRDCFAPG
ncbi:MAG: Uma2 family endonuclease [Anaerolineae bacterium]|nr:Uma2 family endonuclease [Anaerolineae bacterium]